MIGYASNTGTVRNLNALRKSGWRLILTPDNPRRRDGLAYAVENGAWTTHTTGRPFNESRFMRLVEAEGFGADWIVVPDIVAGGLRSLELSESWLPRLRDFNRLLLAVQDGMTEAHVRPLLIEHPRLGIFLGGSTGWKLDTMYDWGKLACAARRYYHVARVNTARRIRLAAESGADSFDGTSASKYAETLPLLEQARRQPSLLVPSRTPWP